MLARCSGILMPLFSLPSPFGIGDLGPGALRFVDSLHAAGQRIWQLLPLTPTEAAHGHSPYHSNSCFAFNPLLISPEGLVADGWADPSDLRQGIRQAHSRVDYAAAVAFKRGLLEKACRRFRQELPPTGYERFCAENSFWLDDYALFSALSARHANTAWDRWPPNARPGRLAGNRGLSKELHGTIETLKIEQYLVYRQWQALRDYCRAKFVQLLGDIPIYLPLHSADVWANRRLFKLDRFCRPRAVSGVPPDYFSADGQLWGHPVYNWKVHRRTRYAWWLRRIAHQIKVFDAARIDHFRGLVAYWEVAAGERTAKRGRWVDVPSDDFFTELQRRFVSLPLVAEDLGCITAEVRETMQRYGFPGMRVLLFGFSGEPDSNPNAVHNIPEHCVVYTGTHDNNTVRGWFETEASNAEKRRLSVVLGPRVAAREVAWELIRVAMLSPARWAVTPIQDLLGLGAAARMNTPGQLQGNWSWRLTAGQLDALPVDRLRELTATVGRA
jgi:4-alpha-glucanotransferase